MFPVEVHPFAAFIPKRPRILILGSFPCFNGTDYGNWYYSGSGRNDFWPLLSQVFSMPTGSRAEKEALCHAQGLAIADVARQIQRTKGNCSDANLKILEYNLAEVAACLKAGVQRIAFTSKFVENLFLKHFPPTNLPTETLLSPSPAIDRYLGGREKYQRLLAAGRIRTAFDYKLLQYRQVLGLPNS